MNSSAKICIILYPLFAIIAKKWISVTTKKIRDHGIEKVESIFKNTRRHCKVCSCCHACQIVVFYVDVRYSNERNYLEYIALGSKDNDSDEVDS